MIRARIKAQWCKIRLGVWALTTQKQYDDCHTNHDKPPMLTRDPRGQMWNSKLLEHYGFTSPKVKASLKRDRAQVLLATYSSVKKTERCGETLELWPQASDGSGKLTENILVAPENPECLHRSAFIGNSTVPNSSKFSQKYQNETPRTTDCIVEKKHSESKKWHGFPMGFGHVWLIRWVGLKLPMWNVW